ncbi:hypothetical protein EHQ53_07460 [Leptospira langatensis]|uniref:DUF8198 domain-containing protein n=1 Tax=Leptospira langatensis TaxID=2484983 RepID=A0A5F1ZU00_9LEPT|nr:hypothetical protein [Leptospira langatensis]TGK01521.1 hypothetical protein EHO57_11410 [Leptospira langatensis]TGL42029.1 hypothetical protein EHQ53_07460 [Leptospira langatensis]
MSSFEEHKLKQAKIEVVRAQVERFRKFYADYFHLEETISMVEYFFETIYNLDGKDAWMHLAMDTYQRVKGMMKETSRANLETLIELNNLTDQLDGEMARLLILRGWDGHKLSREEYDQLYLAYGHQEEREKQLEIVLHNLRTFYELAHKPIAAYLIRPARFMASILGVSLLFESVEKAYNAVLPVSPEIFVSFIEQVEQREWEYLRASFPEETSTTESEW